VFIILLISAQTLVLQTLVLQTLASQSALAQTTPPPTPPTHGIVMHGTPKLAPDFDRFTYTNSRPIIGGRLVQAQLGSFDSLNPFIVRGQAAVGLRAHVFESLMVQHYDEPFALYGLLAERIETPADRTSVTFTLRKQARFSDNRPVTIEDVVFSFETLKTQGRPNHRFYYNKVQRVEFPAPRQIRFVFDKNKPDRELPMIMGLMPILPKHVYEKIDFARTSLAFPIGSGPYMVRDIDTGKQIIYERNPDYWGNSFNFARGRHNFTELRYDYYRDENAAFEAFKAGLVDIWVGRNPLRWQNGFSFPAAQDGRILKEDIANQIPAGLRGFVFNTRRPIFADKRVRRALTEVFNGAWVNKTLYANAYTRTHSYFQKSELSAYNQPADKRERKLLRGARLPTSILEKGYHAPAGDESGQNRQARRTAIKLMQDAGYELRDGIMVHRKTATPFTFEILVQTRENERLALTYRQQLARIGINIKVRFIDATQYQNRLQQFNYDMIVYNWYASLSPGNEQAFYWSSKAATQNGSRNYAGIRNKHIDRLIDALTQAKTRADFIAAARALDRLLMDGNYVVPLFHHPKQWIARWHYIEHNWRHALYGAQLDSWWANPDN
ncbi:MAG: extracellular solute-binding protein, partial [Alphaproteobacteria bacterium]|nr:extracellular solute-binding protein [Alphaproteobacteria bacterium]